MVKVELVKPTLEHVIHIANHMRAADAAEVWASSRKTPLEAMLSGFKYSDRSIVVMVNDEPCAMIGLVIQSILTGTGVVWMLGSDESMNHRKLFLELSPPVIKEMLDVCPMLFNYVHADNKKSIRWLQWLGFTIESPKAHGVEGELFHKFYLEKSNHV